MKAHRVSIKHPNEPWTSLAATHTLPRGQKTGTILGLYIYLLGLLAFIIGGLYFLVDDLASTNALIVITLCLIGLFSSTGLILTNRIDGISFRVIFWFFNLFFFSVGPLAQYLTDRWTFGVTESSMLTANILILLYMGIFAVVYPQGRILANRWIDKTQPKSYMKISLSRLITLALLGLVITSVLMLSVGFEWDSSLTGRAFGVEGILSLFVGFFVRPLVFFTFLFAVIAFKIAPEQRLGHYLILAIALIAALATNFPNTGSRFYVFALYFGLFIILYPPSQKRKGLYLVLLLFVMTFIPQGLLSYARGEPVSDETRVEQEFSITAVFYGSVDAYEGFVNSIDYVRDNGIVWGNQMVGVILFWIPRDYWPDKPVGTGSFIASTYLSTRFFVPYTNLSAAFIEEAYINFSIPGIIVITALIGLISGYVDTKYKVLLDLMRNAVRDRRELLRREHGRYMVLYPIMIGLFLYILRGDLLSSFGYSCGIAAAFVSVSLMVTQRVNLGVPRK